MRRRKGKGISENSKTLDVEDERIEDEEIEENAKDGKRFFACYLLTSLCPRYKGHTYIGFTVNPQRRIRQHNGEICSGAWRTKKRRPWEMVLCIYGFPTNVSALQFEWAWQHPKESLAVRQSAATFKSFSGFANKIKLAYTMLTLPAWQSLNITVNFFSTKYVQHAAVCPKLPEHMKVRVCSMDELPCYTKTDDSSSEDEPDLDDEDDNIENLNARETYSDNMDHSSEDHSLSIDDSTTEQAGQFNEKYDQQQLKDSFNPVDHMLSTSSASTTTWPEDIAIDTKTFGLVNESIIMSEIVMGNCNDDQQPLPRVKLSVQNQPTQRCCTISDQVEVIDLSTPSPSCRVRLRGKKKKGPTLCSPEIIDLSNSPNVIQL